MSDLVLLEKCLRFFQQSAWGTFPSSASEKCFANFQNESTKWRAF